MDRNSGFDYFLELEPQGLADGVDMGYEGRGFSLPSLPRIGPRS